MSKLTFLLNLIASVVMFTLSLVTWFIGDDFGHLHLMILLVSVVGLTVCGFQIKDFHHADDLFDNSFGPDDYEWGTLDAMLRNYKRWYEAELKDNPLYESGMRDIDDWLVRVEQMRSKQ